MGRTPELGRGGVAALLALAAAAAAAAAATAAATAAGHDPWAAGDPSGHDPDAQYIARVAFELQRPANALQWPGRRPAPSDAAAAAAVAAPAPPPLPPPPAPEHARWRLVRFRIAHGNRTIHVRRWVRRRGGSGAGPGPALGSALGPAWGMGIGDVPVEEDDLQTAETRPAAHKLAKLLGLLTVVRFANAPCASAEGVSGTCYHRLECAALGGRAAGVCARGFGVCCVFEVSCGGRVTHNCTYFVSAAWPSAGEGPPHCAVAVERLPGVTQMRLELLTFELAQPTAGDCLEQQFVVSGQDLNSAVPVLCGDNSGQHLYVSVGSSRGPLRLSVTGLRGLPSRFRIKVTQLRGAGPKAQALAPPHCLQYLRGVRGSFASFNYPTSYLNNLNYAICIRKEEGYCSVTYTVRTDNGSDTSFQLVNVDADGEPLVPAGQAGAEAFNCPDDYIVVGGVRLCGDRLNDASVQPDFTQNAPVTDTSNGPLVLGVRSNGAAVGRGFQLDYRQRPCGAAQRRGPHGD